MSSGGGDRQQPPLSISVGVGDATGGWRPGFIVLDVVRIALRLVCSLSVRRQHRLFNPLPVSCSLRRTQPQPPGPPPRKFATLEATRGSTNRPNTTAAAGALKCRPSSFMRRVSTQPTDGCRRSEVRGSRKTRRKFPWVRRRGRRRRKKARGPRAEGEPGAVRRIHEDPRGSTKRKVCQGVTATSCVRTFGGKSYLLIPLRDRECARASRSPRCVLIYVRYGASRVSCRC